MRGRGHREIVVIILRRPRVVGIRVHLGVSVPEVAAHEVIVAASALRVQLLLNPAVEHHRLGDRDRLGVREDLPVGPVLQSPDVDRPVDHRHRVTHLARGPYHGRNVAHGVEPRVDLLAGVRVTRRGALRLRLPRLLPLPPLLAALRLVRFDDRHCYVFARLATVLGCVMVPDVPVQVVLTSKQRLAVFAGKRFLI